MTLKTTAKFPANAEPVGQTSVDLVDGEEPVEGIVAAGRVESSRGAGIYPRSRVRVRMRNGLSMHALPSYPRNEQEKENDTSSHCNLFSPEWEANRGTIRN